MARRILTLGLLAAAAACGTDSNADDEGAAAASMAASRPTVTIVEPAAGDTVEGPDVTVRLANAGFTVTTAGDTTANTGHHHLFLDADVSPAGEPIPAVEGQIVHMGDGSSEYTFHGVAPGEHRLISVVGDAFHVPLQPSVEDTVTFVVAGGGAGM